MRFFKRALPLFLCLILCGCRKVTPAPSAVSAPLPTARTQGKDETVQHDSLSGVWLSYIELDAALKNADPAAAAAYLDGVMRACRKNGVNTVFFHVRAHSDAYYKSAIYAPADSVKALLAAGFDPLAYAIKAAHAQNISLHAWINPYRVGADKSRAVCADIFAVGDKWYYIPSSDTAVRKILDGVREIVDGYAVDGVQYDDYFYPSGMSAEAEDFEKPPAGVSLADYRKAAVNRLIACTCSAVHRRVGCKFGVSPAGNRKRSCDRLFADTARWLSVTGYIDYLCPQLYSGFDNGALPFCTEADDWANLPRTDGVKLYAGLALYKAGLPDGYAGSGRDEWQKGGDIVRRQAEYAAKKGYDGVAVFRFDHLVSPADGIPKTEAENYARYVLTKSAEG